MPFSRNFVVDYDVFFAEDQLVGVCDKVRPGLYLLEGRQEAGLHAK